MPRGQPDYGAYQTKTVGATLADMGDLAVRLGSIVEYDRRGDIVYLDNFENTILKWDRLGVGGGTAALSSGEAKSGSQSVKLNTAAVLVCAINLLKSFVVLGTPRIGAEISLCNLGNNQDFLISLSYWSGAAGHRAVMRYDHSLGNIEVEDTALGNWVVVAHVGAMRLAEHLFYPFKIVADFNTNRYIRCLFGGNEYDLSAILLPPQLLAGGAYYRVGITLNNDLAIAQAAWVDNFILTQNEP